MVHILRAAALSFRLLPGLVLDTCSKSPEEPAERAAVLLWTAAHPLPTARFWDCRMNSAPRRSSTTGSAGASVSSTGHAANNS